jgi:putative ATP-dependent endonuclease of OLD family
MKITRVRIENFRSIRELEVELGDTNVFIGANDVGKTAILDAIRIVLSRRWGQRGTGFTEQDIHRPEEGGDPRTLPAVTITLTFEEPSPGIWDADMVAALDDILAVYPDGRNVLSLRTVCAWNSEKETYDPTWQFLDTAGLPLPEKRRSINLTGFFAYVPFFWLGALRDAADEFTPRSGHWGRLLKSIRIPDALEDEALGILRELDARIVAADPRLNEIAAKIGEATKVAIGDKPGGARVNTLPQAIEEMLQRTGVVVRTEESRPWLPLSHHGQGLQSLAVIFLFQAAVIQQLAESERTGVEAIFAVEEPEAHLHPHAARTLWERVANLSGQKLMTTHSPYFLQRVPLRDIRSVCLRNGCTRVSAIPRFLVSDLPWNESVDGFVRGCGGRIFFKDFASNNMAARSWFDEQMADRLIRCFRDDPARGTRLESVYRLRYNCRILPTEEEERELGFHGRRVRGEIFFAKRWILVEGVSEYLLLHAMSKSLGWPLDEHGVTVIDFQQSGNASIYPGLADAFGVPWNMIVDGDSEGSRFRDQILDRGFTGGEVDQRLAMLTTPNTLEDQLIADGHGPLLREILADFVGNNAHVCPDAEFRAIAKNRKVPCMGSLSLRVLNDAELAGRMPAPFVGLIDNLRRGTA